MKPSTTITLSLLNFLALTRAEISIAMYSDYYCTDQIYSFSCSDVWETCAEQGIWWNSYIVTPSDDNQCNDFAGDAFWDSFFMGFSNCGEGSATFLGGGCGQNPGCQQTRNLDDSPAYPWQPGNAVTCQEDFSISGVDGG